MKKTVYIFLLIFLILGMQNAFASSNSANLKREIDIFGIYDYKVIGAGKVNDKKFHSDAEDSLFDESGNFGAGMNLRFRTSENFAFGPSVSVYWAETKDDRTYYRIAIDASATCTLVNGKSVDFFTEVGLGVDYSQLDTCSTIGFDGNLGLGLKVRLGDQVYLMLNPALSLLVEPYERDGEICCATQYDIPTKLGLAFKF